jgi:hypothetical protein
MNLMRWLPCFVFMEPLPVGFDLQKIAWPCLKGTVHVPGGPLGFVSQKLSLTVSSGTDSKDTRVDIGFDLQKSGAIPSLTSGTDVFGGTPPGVGFDLQKILTALSVIDTAVAGAVARQPVGFDLQNSGMV